MDPYATHLEGLVMGALLSSGPILEMGCGDYSTPVLAAIARQQGRDFHVVTADAEWASKFVGIEGLSGITIVDWKTWKPTSHYGMVFLDQDQLVRDRVKHLPELKKHADYIVAHDAQIAMNHWEVDDCEVTMLTRYLPWTAIIKCSR